MKQPKIKGVKIKAVSDHADVPIEMPIREATISQYADDTWSAFVPDKQGEMGTGLTRGPSLEKTLDFVRELLLRQ